MPLSAAFHLFSPLLYENKYHIQLFLFHPFLSFSLFISLFCQFSFNAYIRNLALTTKR